jgi:hypothetical protein
MCRRLRFQNATFDCVVNHVKALFRWVHGALLCLGLCRARATESLPIVARGPIRSKFTRRHSRCFAMKGSFTY